ncbi:unnamed protein product [Heterobilharzia americana]|nr:unnamed protein product [Heterobilharzia americana]
MMPGQSQRGKIKSMRARNQRMPISSANASRLTHTQNTSDEGLGIYANPGLTYILGRHVIADLGLTYAQVAHKNDKGSRKNVTDKTVFWSEIKMVRIPNIKRSDCLINDIKTDSEIAKECPTNNFVVDKELVPFFASSDGVKDCLLDQGSFSAVEMFETNEKMFSVSSTYNADLREYTTPVDRSAPNFPETEARCAKLAQDITENFSGMGLMDDEGDISLENEEEKYSAVVRPGTVQNAVRSAKSSHRSNVVSQLESTVNSSGSQLSQVCIQSSKASHSEAVRVSISVGDTLKSDGGPQVNGVSKPCVQNDKDKSKQSYDQLPEVSNSVSVSTTTSYIKNSTADAPVTSVGKTSTSEGRVKKSTLDPNAPEFQPMGLSYNSQSMVNIAQNLQSTLPSFSAQGIHIPQHYMSTMNVISQAPQLPGQTAFIAAGQQMYTPFPYSHQAQMQHLLTTPVCSNGPGAAQQIRGNSLPPLNQQSYANHGHGMLPQLGQGVSLGQIITTPQMITGHNSSGRLSVCPSSSVNLTRQRSNDSPSAVTHCTSYAIQQPAMSIPTFQSQAVYQLPQPNGAFPFLVSSHPQMGLQFLPGLPTAVSSGLMVGGVHVSQASNQQVCPTHTIMQMQPTHLQLPVGQSDQVTAPSTTQQTSQSQQMFPQHFQDHPHPSQIHSYPNVPAPYQHNLMFAPQQNASGFYPAMVAGPGTVSHVAGLSPVVGQPNPHSLNASIPHQSNQPDSSLINSQQIQQSHMMPQPNCQPQQLLQHYPAVAQAQFLQAQQLSAAQHMSGQHLPNSHTYHAALLAAMTAGGAAGAPQSH